MLTGGDSGPALVPGQAGASLLYRAATQAGELKMPPKGKRLAAEDLQILKAWIDAGAPWTPTAATITSNPGPSWWAFRKPQRPALPPVKNQAWVRNPIDAFVLAKLEEKGLSPAPPADKRTLLRRAAFDLLGLPPSPEQVEKFVQDTSAEAWAKVIDELLRSPHYGERWGRHWLDVARYADSGGYETDIYYRNAWRYRDYVIKSFNDDKPYDRFVREQVACDELAPNDLSLEGSYDLPKAKLEHLEARIGTGFYALGPQIHESNMDIKRFAYERLTDWADTTGSVFLGLTLGCARCHDHKFDPLTQRDYYRLQAVFAASKEVEVPVVHAMAIASNRQHYPRLLAVDEARKAYRLFEKKLQAKGGKATPAEEQERRRLLDRIAAAVLELPENIPDAPGGPWDGLMEVPTASVLGHHEPAFVPAVHVLQRGDLRRPKEPVSPGFPVVLCESGEARESFPPFRSRKELALWLTRPGHPLTARVMANRVWLWHFGRGLVSTPNDFGKMGQPPTHPELLDWLATEFVARGWSLKAMHRLILQSSAYQMASARDDAKAARLDPDNRYLWRMNRRRLEGEALWDALHATAGTLNPAMGGRPVVPPLADEEIRPLRDKWQWTVTADPKEHTRRGVYLLVRRNFRFPMFEVFDAPVNSVSCPCRDVTTVAPQALWSLNNQTAYRQAQAFAGRLVREAGNRPAAWVERAWRVALGRAPSEEEKREALRLLDALAAKGAAKPQESPPAALAKLCLAIFNLNEFAYAD
jgi:hypothetical protein